MPEDSLASTCEKYLYVMEVYVDDFCTMVQTLEVDKLRHISRTLLHAINSVLPPPVITNHAGGDPVSLKKILEEEGIWDVRKDILGWVFDGAKQCIELPTKKLDAITNEIKKALRKPHIQLKKIEKLVEKLFHAAIGLPVEKGLCATFNRTTIVHTQHVALGKQGLVRATLVDWLRLLTEIQKQPSHINELVGQPIPDVVRMDTFKIGAGVYG